MRVNVLMSIPASLESRLSKVSLRRKDVEMWGASWDKASVLCRKQGLIIDFGTEIDKLRKGEP